MEGKHSKQAVFMKQYPWFQLINEYYSPLMDKLNTLRLLLAAHEAGSFAQAAVNLGIAPSTLSKAINRLESALDVRLLNRTTRKIQLTAAGQAYVATARQVLEQLDETEQQLSNERSAPQGQLKINLPVSYGRLYVLPLLPTFLEQYPDIQIDVSFSDQYVDMVNQGVDVAIRSGKLPDSRLVASKLSPMDFVICAAPSYIQQYGQPLAISEFAQHRWVRFRFQQSGRLFPILVEQAGHEHEVEPGTTIVTDDGEALVSLAASGLGLTQVPHFLARDLVQKKQLLIIGKPYRSPQLDVHIYYLSKQHLPNKIRVFVDFMKQALAEQGESPRHTWVQ